MKNYGDICKINGSLVEAVDCVIGGSPCQNLSVAGNRLGLEGNESRLFLEQMRLICEMRQSSDFTKPRYMIFENVTGALSCNKGKDFQRVLCECVRAAMLGKVKEQSNGENETDEDGIKTEIPDVPMPKDGKWPKSGMLYDDLGRWSIAWRVHDAQYWGVAQRRRRLSLVVDFGGMSAPEVLFEQQSMQRNSDEGDTQREGVAEAADGSIAESNQVWDARGNGDGKLCSTITGDHDNRITDYTNVIVERDDCDKEPWLLESNQNHATVTNNGICSTLPASMGMGGGYVPMVTEEIGESHIQNKKTSFCINGDAHESGMSCVEEVSHTLKVTTKEVVAVPEKASETSIVIDRAGFNQGKNAAYNPYIEEGELMPTLVSHVPHAVCQKVSDQQTQEVFYVHENTRCELRLSDIAYSLTCVGGKPGQSYPCICIGNGQAHVTEHYTEELSQTLNCMHDPMTILEPVHNESTSQKAYGICSFGSNCMKSSNPHSGIYEAETSRTLDAGTCGNPSCNQGGIAIVDTQNVTYKVRRLTPLECTRLQGYPDGWVDIGDWVDSKGKKHKDADSPKYKALGNSIALPFWKWLCGNIVTTLQSQGNACPTMASLFDGIGGFPLCWNTSGGKTLWISEIEEFPLAVTQRHFPN